MVGLSSDWRFPGVETPRIRYERRFVLGLRFPEVVIPRIEDERRFTPRGVTVTSIAGDARFPKVENP